MFVPVDVCINLVNEVAIVIARVVREFKLVCFIYIHLGCLTDLHGVELVRNS